MVRRGSRLRVAKEVELKLYEATERAVPGKVKGETCHRSLELRYVKDNQGAESLNVWTIEESANGRQTTANYTVQAEEDIVKLREFFKEILSDTIDLSPRTVIKDEAGDAGGE